MSLRVSLAAAPRVRAEAERPAPLLDPRGARVVLGARAADGLPAAPIAPAADTLFGARGAVLVAPDGPLLVCDTGHHRLMIWNRAPAADSTSADLLIGQTDFCCEGRNGGGDAGPATFNVPTGIAAEGGVLAIADAWNHRVLVWHGLPARWNQPADVVLGQPDFTSTLPNRGGAPGPDTLNWCYGVALHDGRLYVADTGNRRVLVWKQIPERNGIPADLVLGQRDFATRDDAGGTDARDAGMRWPHAIAVSGDKLFVADAGRSRVMGWHGLPKADGRPCDFVLGQRDIQASDHNEGEYLPTAASMNMPYGLCTAKNRLVVADTANSRLVGFDLGALGIGQAANRLSGQCTFADRGDNRWQTPKRDSLCWPYGVSACGSTVVVADSGNNRVMLWESA